MTKNWEIHVTFKVHGKGSELFGDGFAIWYTKHRMESGPVFGSKDHFSGLAIILDTYSNHNGPHNVSYYLDNLYTNYNARFHPISHSIFTSHRSLNLLPLHHSGI